MFFFNYALADNHKIMSCDGKQIWGNVEKVFLVEKNVALDAKLDTGAEMTSLSAQHITYFKQKDRTWVRFSLTDGAKTFFFIKPLEKMTTILMRQEESQINKKIRTYRPVIKMVIRIGSQQKAVLVNLTDRRYFHYPMLIGKEALKNFNVLVDVNRNYLVSHSSPAR